MEREIFVSGVRTVETMGGNTATSPAIRTATSHFKNRVAEDIREESD
jgi:hypothetical protein